MRIMMMKVLKSPMGFLGGLPGPSVWKQLRKAVLTKLKSMFSEEDFYGLVFISSR